MLNLVSSNKYCKGCGIVKPYSEYYVRKNPSGTKVPTTACIACMKENNTKRYKNLAKKGSALVTLKEKTCSKCKKTQPSSEFYPSVMNKTGLNARCRTCTGAQTKQHLKDNPEKYRNKRIKMKYGITLDQAKAMLADQSGLCGNRACGKELSFEVRDCNHPNKAKVDHCHKTGKVRGILCDTCNLALGWVEHKNKILGLIEYFDKHSTLL